MIKHAAPVIRAAVFLAALTSIAGAQAQSPATTKDATGVTSAKGIVVGPNNTPQAGVPVQIVGPPGQTVAITDKEGKWSVYNLPAGDYKVKMIGPTNSSTTKQVGFSVKEPSFFDKWLGGTSGTVTSPAIEVETTR